MYAQVEERKAKYDAYKAKEAVLMAKSEASWREYQKARGTAGRLRLAGWWAAPTGVCALRMSRTGVCVRALTAMPVCGRAHLWLDTAAALWQGNSKTQSCPPN
jgi:hypothetical protein